MNDETIRALLIEINNLARELERLKTNNNFSIFIDNKFPSFPQHNQLSIRTDIIEPAKTGGTLFRYDGSKKQWLVVN